MSKKNKKTNWKSQRKPQPLELSSELQHARQHNDEFVARVTSCPCEPGVNLLLDLSQFGELAFDVVHTERSEAASENIGRLQNAILDILLHQPVVDSVSAVLGVIATINATPMEEPDYLIEIPTATPVIN